jgi:hypothetical protein
MHPTRELSEIARESCHLQAEHEREGAEGSWRRRQGARLAELERHFETLLERWVDAPTERDHWREHFYRGGSRPEPGVAAEAVEALTGFLRGAERQPPWRWASVLHADGIIDPTFALTERGQRLLHGVSR